MVAHIMNAVTIAQMLSAMNDWLEKKTTMTITNGQLIIKYFN